MTANQAELEANIRESIAIANKALPTMDPEAARSIACALNLHLHRSMVEFFRPRHPGIVDEARAIHAENCDSPAYRVAAMWLAMEEQAGCAIESFPGAGDWMERLVAKNEQTMRDLIGDSR